MITRHLLFALKLVHARHIVDLKKPRLHVLVDENVETQNLERLRRCEALPRKRVLRIRIQ